MKLPGWGKLGVGFLAVSRSSHFSMTFNFVSLIHGSLGVSWYILLRKLLDLLFCPLGYKLFSVPFLSNLQRAQY